MTVADIMTREFELVHEEATLLQAMRHLRDCPLVEDEIGIKCVIVLNRDEELVGILTQSDVVGEILFPYFVRDLANQGGAKPTIRDEDYRALAAWATKVKVKDVMSRKPVTLAPGEIRCISTGIAIEVPRGFEAGLEAFLVAVIDASLFAQNVVVEKSEGGVFEGIPVVKFHVD